MTLRSHLIFWAALLLCWELLAAIGDLRFFAGDPHSIALTLFRDSATGELPRDALITGAEAALGFLIGTVCGTLIGFALWCTPRFALLAQPLLLAIGAVPIFAFAPLVIVWFGIGFSMKVAVATLGTTLVALHQSFHGAKEFRTRSERFLLLAGASRRQVLMKGVVPSSIRSVLQGMHLSVSTTVLGAFIGEFISSSEGVGHYMNQRGALYDVPAVFAGGCYLVLISFVLQLLVSALVRRQRALLRLLPGTMPRISPGEGAPG